jgi:hypothetical protein
MTPARNALLAFAEAWTNPILGNEDVPVTNRLFEQARVLPKDAATSMADPPKLAGWLEILRDKSRDGSHEWEDAARGDGLLRALDGYLIRPLAAHD